MWRSRDRGGLQDSSPSSLPGEGGQESVSGSGSQSHGSGCPLSHVDLRSAQGQAGTG